MPRKMKSNGLSPPIEMARNMYDFQSNYWPNDHHQVMTTATIAKHDVSQRSYHQPESQYQTSYDYGNGMIDDSDCQLFQNPAPRHESAPGRRVSVILNPPLVLESEDESDTEETLASVSPVLPKKEATISLMEQMTADKAMFSSDKKPLKQTKILSRPKAKRTITPAWSPEREDQETFGVKHKPAAEITWEWGAQDEPEVGLTESNPSPVSDDSKDEANEDERGNGRPSRKRRDSSSPKSTRNAKRQRKLYNSSSSSDDDSDNDGKSVEGNQQRSKSGRRIRKTAAARAADQQAADDSDDSSDERNKRRSKSGRRLKKTPAARAAARQAADDSDDDGQQLKKSPVAKKIMAKKAFAKQSPAQESTSFEWDDKVHGVLKMSKSEIERLSFWPKEGALVDEIHPNDVIFGRGAQFALYAGNQMFRHIVWSFRKVYLSASTRNPSKNFIARKVLARVASLDPPGRFLMPSLHTDEDGNALFEVSTKHRALEKASQCLRERRTNPPNPTIVIRHDLPMYVNPSARTTRRKRL